MWQRSSLLALRYAVNVALEWYAGTGAKGIRRNFA